MLLKPWVNLPSTQIKCMTDLTITLTAQKDKSHTETFPKDQVADRVDNVDNYVGTSGCSRGQGRPGVKLIDYHERTHQDSGTRWMMTANLAYIGILI